MDPDKVFVVRSGPSLERLKIVPPVDALKRGRRYLVGYVGVMGRQEGIDYLLRRRGAHRARAAAAHDMHFGLVGGGTSLDEMKALRARARRRRLRHLHRPRARRASCSRCSTPPTSA